MGCRRGGLGGRVRRPGRTLSAPRGILTPVRGTLAAASGTLAAPSGTLSRRQRSVIMDRSVITDAWPRQVTAGVRDQYLGRDRGALAARVDGAGWPDRARNSVVGPTLLLAPLSLTAT